MGKHFRLQIFYGVITLLAILVAFSYSTYAWFTLTTYVNVDPMQGGIGHGDGNLQIAVGREGPFDVSCELAPLSGKVDLQPVSTGDLTDFYKVALQNRDGISVRFDECTEQVNSRTIHGFLYLRSLDAAAAIYLNPEGLSFGQDAQALAAMRLGLRITTQAGTETHIVKLDSLATERVEARSTVERVNSVVSAVRDDGRPVLTDDPAVELTAYCAHSIGNDEFAAGQRALCTIQTDEVAEVEYWLYLEGCDENCFNPVRANNVALQLAFAGVRADR